MTIWHQQKRWVFFFNLGPLQDPCEHLLNLLNLRTCLHILHFFEHHAYFVCSEWSGWIIWIGWDRWVHNVHTAKPFVLIFCLNLKSIQFHLRTVRMQEEEDSSSSPKQLDRAARARNLSNPGCDARNPGGGTKLAQARFQSSSGKHFQGIFQSWVKDNLYGHEFGNLLGSL